jgi:Tfp pilus assembly protein PilF
MHIRSRLAAPGALLLGLSLIAGGCGKYSLDNLKARTAFREGTNKYKGGEYKAASEAYERTLQLANLEADPDLIHAYFFLANSYDNLYKPANAGNPENDAYLQKAVENYKLAAERETDPTWRRRALEYLVAAYGPDKMNRPDEAEPLVLKMIEMDPKEITNYFALSRIYQDAGRYEEAEAALIKARDVRRSDPTVYNALAEFYNKQGDFPKTIQALEDRAGQEPNNPEAYHLIGTFYWEKAAKDFRLTAAEKKDYILKGIAAEDKAMALKDDYLEAMTYKNILLRMQANVEKDRKVIDALIREADRLRNRAIELQKAKTAGTSGQ